MRPGNARDQRLGDDRAAEGGDDVRGELDDLLDHLVAVDRATRDVGRPRAVGCQRAERTEEVLLARRAGTEVLTFDRVDLLPRPRGWRPDRHSTASQ